MNISPIKIVEKRNLWFSLSLLVIFAGIVMMMFRGAQSKPFLNFGTDFSGGTTMILRFEDWNRLHPNQGPELLDKLRDSLAPFGLSHSAIQLTQENDAIIKTAHLDNAQADQIRGHLHAQFGTIDVLEIDFIGPSIGAELKTRSIWIVALVSVVLLGYISWRFEFSFGMGALVATLHDAFIILSIASIFYLEINTEFVAAVLTILGYSIMDTIVIFDRIRENLPQIQSGASVESIANKSLVQTLTRTLYTALTTLMVLLCLLIFGGATIKPFCLVLIVGVIVGTYSSIFTATPFWVWIYKRNHHVGS